MTKAAINQPPVHLASGEHLIDNKNIDPRVLNILRTLNRAGFCAYLVGGSIRDLLLGETPKDFDIATDARPAQIAKLFRNCRLIGRRFRLAHIYFGRDIIEVATFRSPPDSNTLTDCYGSVLEDNHYGNIEDDVIRRDFSVNALYYDAASGEIIDYLGALDDIQARILRIIGDPEARYREDPVRMLRAARFSAKLDMPLEEKTAAAIATCRDNLRAVPPARLFDECQKLFLSGHGKASFVELLRYDLFTMIFPDAERIFHHPNHAYAQYAQNIIHCALNSTDKRVAEDKPVTIAFVFAAILWPAFQLQYRGLLGERENWHSAMEEAANLIHIAAGDRVSIPMRLRGMIHDIWILQARLELAARGNRRKMEAVLSSPRFRAAYDFLLLRQQAGEPLDELVELWTELQEQDSGQDDDENNHYRHSLRGEKSHFGRSNRRRRRSP